MPRSSAWPSRPDPGRSGSAFRHRAHADLDFDPGDGAAWTPGILERRRCEPWSLVLKARRRRRRRGGRRPALRADDPRGGWAACGFVASGTAAGLDSEEDGWRRSQRTSARGADVNKRPKAQCSRRTLVAAGEADRAVSAWRGGDAIITTSPRSGWAGWRWLIMRPKKACSGRTGWHVDTAPDKASARPPVGQAGALTNLVQPVTCAGSFWARSSRRWIFRRTRPSRTIADRAGPVWTSARPAPSPRPTSWMRGAAFPI